MSQSQTVLANRNVVPVAAAPVGGCWLSTLFLDSKFPLSELGLNIGLFDHCRTLYLDVGSEPGGDQDVRLHVGLIGLEPSVLIPKHPMNDLCLAPERTICIYRSVKKRRPRCLLLVTPQLVAEESVRVAMKIA